MPALHTTNSTVVCQPKPCAQAEELAGANFMQATAFIPQAVQKRNHSSNMLKIRHTRSAQAIANFTPRLLMQATPGQQTVLAEADELLQGCRQQLEGLHPAALNNEDVLGSLLINGWFQRFYLM